MKTQRTGLTHSATRTTRTPSNPIGTSAVAHVEKSGAEKAQEQVFARTKPSERKPSSLVDAHALLPMLDDVAVFGKHAPIASIAIESQKELASTEKDARHLLINAKVHYDDGKTERFLVPVSLARDGTPSLGLESDAFKKDLLAAVERGESFESSSSSSSRTSRRSGAHGPVGARLAKVNIDRTHAASSVRSAKSASSAASTDAHTDAANIARAVYDGAKVEPWRTMLDKGYTTRERYEYVVDQAKKLSPENADALVSTFFRAVIAAKDAQPESVKQFHEALATRPKFAPVFYGYAQFIGVPDGKKTSTFDDVAQTLDLIGSGTAQAQNGLGTMVRAKGFGFHEMELLPFYASPQKDGGYDITDHAQVADELGGNPAFERFMGHAVDRGMRVTADLVANHVSGEHVWAKALEAGDESVLSRFVAWDDAVKLGERKVDDKTFNVFLHTRGENAGKVSHVWQIFPENNPDTFILAEGHKIFASFMNPYQWDVNVADPQVLGYYLNTLGTFANLGQMGTRMDAIIHSGKKPGTFNINNPEAQAFMALAKSFASHLVPGNMFLPEANLPWDEAKRDWLSPERAFDGKVENTAGDVLISFDVHRAIWDTLLKSDKHAWMKAQDELGELPPNKSLLVYLGLHDETLIDDPKLREELHKRGFHDFAGRGVGDSPAALLEGNADRLAMAHVLLYSSKGHPAVYYRTLIGSPNNDEYYENKIADRLKDQEKAGQTPDVKKARDTRDLDRGPVALADYEKALADGYKPAVTVRALNALWDANASVRTNDVVEVANSDASIVSFARKSDEAKPLLQLVNLSGAAKTVTMSKAELAQKLGADWSSLSSANRLRDLLATEMSGAAHDVPVKIDGDRVSFELRPYEAVYLER